jgi:hypothetical protein
MQAIQGFLSSLEQWGAHWISELTKYEQEDDDQWTTILSKKSRRAKSYADVVC